MFDKDFTKKIRSFKCKKQRKCPREAKIKVKFAKSKINSSHF